MAPLKYFQRLLIIAGIFTLFFVITIMSISLVQEYTGIDRSSRSSLLIMAVIQSVVLFICPSLLSARLVSEKTFSFLSLDRGPGWLPVLGIVFAYLIALPFLNQLIFWNANISFPDVIADWGETLREMEDNANNASGRMLDVTSWPGLVVNLLMIGVLTAFGEELFFRGTLQNAAASAGAPHTAIWVVALIFSAMHFQVFGFVPRLLLGAWFGYLLYWTKSIYVPVLAHFINNGIVVLCSWLVSRGVNYDFENFGVVDTGFPVPAFVSCLAFVVFIVFFRRFFFHREEKYKNIVYG